MHDKDIISKQLLKRMTLGMARILLGLDIIEIDLLETEQQRIEDRRADLVAKVKDQSGQYILHIEIQNGNQGNMPNRMLRYYSDISLAYPDLDIKQTLIYIGKAKLSMRSGIEQSSLSYRYQILDMHSIDCENLLRQNVPEALVFAILSDFGNLDSREVVHRILVRLQELTGKNEAAFRDYLLMLEILSSNRDLKQILQEEENMLSQIKYSDLPSYGLGMQQGRIEGRNEGRQEGILQGETTILQNQLKLKFGSIPDDITRRVLSADSAELLLWSERILSSNNLSDIFAEH